MIFNSINNQISQYEPLSTHKHKRYYINRNSSYGGINSNFNQISSSFPRLSAQNDTFNPTNRKEFYQSGTQLSKMNKQIIENTEMFCKRSEIKRNKIFGHNLKSNSSQKSLKTLSHLSQSNVSRSSNHSYDRTSKNSNNKKFSDYQYDINHYRQKNNNSRSKYKIFQEEKHKNYNPYLNTFKEEDKPSPLDLDFNKKKKQFSSPLVIFNYQTPQNQPVQDYQKFRDIQYQKSPSRTLLLDRGSKRKSPTFRSEILQSQNDERHFTQQSYPEHQIEEKDRFFDMQEAPSSRVKRISYSEVDPLPKQTKNVIQIKPIQKSFLNRLFQKYKQTDKDGKIISGVLIFLGILILILQMLN